MVKAYHDLQTFANPFIGSRRKTRRLNTLLLACAILRMLTFSLTQLARSLPAPKKVNYPLKRFWRFLGNEDAIPLTSGGRAAHGWWSGWLSSPFLLIALDATYLGNRWLLLAAMVPFQKRALPLQ